MRLLDMSDLRFGRLVVAAISQREHGQVYWRCICDCGVKCVVMGPNLRTGHTKSCGCWRRGAGDRTRTHGMSVSREYKSWRSMFDRCKNPNAPNYERYGGAGIKICRRWSRFERFFADMGERPVGTTLDRIQSTGDYKPSNCRWATPKEQASNRRAPRRR